VHGAAGEWADVNFLWLAADSADFAKVDLSKRNAVLLYADVAGNGMTRPTEAARLAGGARAFLVASLRDPFGVVHIRVTPAEITPDAVILRASAQQLPLSASGEIPAALETAWPADSPPVHASFGTSTEMQLTDQNGHTWNIVLHPDRIGPT
jgi:hypothetical protein